MEWGLEQQKALQEVDKWIKDPSGPQVFRLFGFAGTGKTTLAKHLAEGVDGRVDFAAFTGKAAHVLTKKGCPASTIHRLIYQYVPETNPPEFELNEEALDSTKLLVLDEVSMVNEELGMDLESFGKKILVLGDPAQLPPVKGAGYFINAKPDIMLTEVHRQAEENPIIKMATMVRNQRPVPIGMYGESRVQFAMQANLVMECDQFIVGKNDTRKVANERARDLMQREGLLQVDPMSPSLPVPGDKIICLRNNHRKGLMNGSIWFVEEVSQEYDERLADMQDVDTPADMVEEPGFLWLNLRSEDGEVRLSRVKSHYWPFIGDEPEWRERRRANEFDFAYAITCHKSQGSQWDSVVIADESRIFGHNKWKWLYTAITRAAEKVTVCMR